jgi:excisionase family DNA binding protein
MKITRVQFAEKTVSAADEEGALEKIRVEVQKPYGFLGAWTTGAVDFEIISVESRVGDVPTDPIEGPLLFSVKMASERLGVSTSVLYELVRAGEIEHVRVGRRILFSHAGLEKFIETHSKVGYQ